MTVGGSDPALTVLRHSGGPERAVDERPTFLLASSRRFCATCMKRKTLWLVSWGPFCKHRRCFSCMSDREREAFRAGY